MRRNNFIDFVFNKKLNIKTYNYNNHDVWLSTDIANALGLLCSTAISANINLWHKDEYIENEDYFRVTCFKQCKQLLCDNNNKTMNLIVLTKSGVSTAIMLANTRSAIAARERLVNKVNENIKNETITKQQLTPRKNMETSLTVTNFNFNNNSCNVYYLEDEPVWLAQEVSIAMGYKRADQLSSNIDRRWKENLREGVDFKRIKDSSVCSAIVDSCVTATLTCAKLRQITILTESGINKVLMLAKTKGALAFQNFLADTVIPSIRRTGNYISNTQALESDINNARIELMAKQVNGLKTSFDELKAFMDDSMKNLFAKTTTVTANTTATITPTTMGNSDTLDVYNKIQSLADKLYSKTDTLTATDICNAIGKPGKHCEFGGNVPKHIKNNTFYCMTQQWNSKGRGKPSKTYLYTKEGFIKILNGLSPHWLRNIK